MKKQLVKGFNDYLGAEALKRAKVMKIIREQFELYGFEPAETPTVEYEEFVRGTPLDTKDQTGQVGMIGFSFLIRILGMGFIRRF